MTELRGFWLSAGEVQAETGSSLFFLWCSKCVARSGTHATVCNSSRRRHTSAPRNAASTSQSVNERLRQLTADYFSAVPEKRLSDDDKFLAHLVDVLRVYSAAGLANRWGPLDIYPRLTYRISYLKKPSLIPWEALQTQFGADYRRLRDFKRKLLVHLADVRHVYPAARLSQQAKGLLLRPSPTHLPRAGGRTRRLT